MKKIAVTGGIASGKSTVCRIFKHLGVPVFDADATVHRLYATQSVKNWFRERTPEVLSEGMVQRQVLSGLIRQRPDFLAEIEAMIHPLVWQEEQKFLRRFEQAGSSIVVSDIPLLFESGREGDYEIVLLVTAPLWLRKKRALQRPGMTAEKLDNILSRQLDDATKRKYAHKIVHTGAGYAETARQVRKLCFACGRGANTLVERRLH